MHKLLIRGNVLGRTELAKTLVSFTKAIYFRVACGELFSLPVGSILDLDESLYFLPGGFPWLGFLEFFKRFLHDFIIPHPHAIPKDAKPIILWALNGVPVAGHRLPSLIKLAWDKRPSFLLSILTHIRVVSLIGPGIQPYNFWVLRDLIAHPVHLKPNFHIIPPCNFF